MKVLHVAGALNGRMGGPTQSLIADCLAIRERNWDCVVAAPKADDEASEEIRDRLKRSGVQLVEFELDLRGRAVMWGLSWKFVVWLSRHEREFDVVHTRGVWFLPGFAGLAIARAIALPAVTSPTASLTRFNARDTRSTWTKHLKTFLRPIHDSLGPIVVFSSEYERADSWNKGLRGRSRVVHHALPDEKFLARTRRTDHAKGLTIGYIGRLDPVKNVDLLIEALATIDPVVRLVVAGAGVPEYEAKLRSVAVRLGVQDRIQWRGFLPPSAHAEFFEVVDLVAMPSKQESFGLAAAEAMAAGIPVVVTARSGIADIVRRSGGGRVVQPKVAHLRDALTEVLSMSSAERDLLGAQAHSGALTELTIQAHGASLELVYQEAIARKRR